MRSTFRELRLLRKEIGILHLGSIEHGGIGMVLGA